MTYLEILSDMLRDNNFNINVNKPRKHITFSYKKEYGAALFGHNNNYQLAIQGHDAKISRVKLKSRSSNGRTFFIPEHRTLLSVDLYDPRSIETIRDWLETLR